MKTHQVKAEIQRGAAEVRRLHGDLNAAFGQRDRSPEHREAWSEAARLFREGYDALAFPGGWNSARDRIEAGELDAIEAGLCFLELRPFFHRSGYMYDALIPKLKRASLDASQAARMGAFLKRYAEWRASRRGDGSDED